MHKTLCGITKKFSLTKEIFREINYQVTYYVNQLLSRNFCLKCVKENLPQCQNYGNLLPPFCRKNSVKATFSLDFTLNWFDEKYFAWQWISRFSTMCLRNFHTVKNVRTLLNFCDINLEVEMENGLTKIWMISLVIFIRWEIWGKNFVTPRGWSVQ